MKVRPKKYPDQIVTTNLLPLLGVNPIRGRLFAPDEGKEGNNRMLPSLVMVFGNGDLVAMKIWLVEPSN